MVDKKHKRRLHAFTLVELLVVMSIVGAIAGGAMLVSSGMLKKAKQNGAVADLLELDAWARRASKRGQASLRIDLQQQVAWVRVSTSQTGTSARTPELVTSGGVGSRGAEGEKSVVMPPGVRVTMLMSHGTMRDTGVIELQYRDGGCPTYAIQVESRGGQTTWVVTSGPTGIRTKYEHSAETQEQLAKWFGQWTSPR